LICYWLLSATNVLSIVELKCVIQSSPLEQLWYVF